MSDWYALYSAAEDEIERLRAALDIARSGFRDIAQNPNCSGTSLARLAKVCNAQLELAVAGSIASPVSGSSHEGSYVGGSPKPLAGNAATVKKCEACQLSWEASVEYCPGCGEPVASAGPKGED